jgi:hypothetical protein
MPNPQLQTELYSLKAKLAASKGLISSAQGQASVPVAPNTPAVGLITLAQAVSAQQDALDQIYKLLEKMA